MSLSSLSDRQRSVKPTGERSRLPAAGLAVVGAAVVVAGAAVVGGDFPTLLFAGAVVIALFFGVLNSPTVAILVLFLTTYARLGLEEIGPVNPFVIAYAGMLASVAVWLLRDRANRIRLGAVEWAMIAYVLWNVFSMLYPHELDATVPLLGDPFSVPRFILTGTVIPFTTFVVGRFVIRSQSSIRVLLWSVVVLGAYSTFVSIAQFYGPKGLVWPRYIIDEPSWPERAVGVFNQPVVNGLVLVVAFTIALLFLAERPFRFWRSALLFAFAGASAFALYLTHTRAAYLSFAVVLVVGALFARGFRTGFVVSIVAAVVGVAANWSTFTSDDRSAGGVGSVSELEDRLNGIATSLWAFEQKPILGWGIGRFTALNTYHHKQWSPEVPWDRGHGIASHFNELGILAELGIVGLALWLAVLGTIAVALVRAYRRLPDDGLCGRRLALISMMAFGCLIVTGFTVELRFFDYPNAMILLIAGMVIGCSDRFGTEVPPKRARPLRSVVRS